MPYGIIKIDTVTFTDAGVDKSVSISGLVQNPTFSGNVTVTGTLSGVTVTGTTASFTSGNFTNISGGTHTITSGVFAAGSAANPSISFTSDPNTGIYSPGADQVAISTNGTGRLFVDANGNVGIGSSPLANSVVINRGTEALLRLQSSVSGGTVSDGVLLSIDSSNQGYLWNYENAPFLFGTNNTERLRITSDGKVGLGTSSPGATLSVLSTASASTPAVQFASSASLANNDIFRLQINGLTNGMRMFQDASSNVIYSFEGGRVGVGTTTPSETLHINGTARLGTTAHTFYANNIACLSSSADTTIDASSAQLILKAGGGEAARLDASKRLLVGTSTSPSAGGQAQYAKFVVAGNTSSATTQGILNITRGQAASGTIGADTEVGHINFTDSVGNEFARITCATDAAVSSASDLPGRLVFSTTADGASSPTERMRISNNGIIAIKTSSNDITVGGTIGTTIAATTRSGIHFGTPASLIPTDGDGTLTDNACSLGIGAYRWSTVYAGTGTINTSDANLKQDIEDLEQAELNVATTIKGLIKKFRFIDAVAGKGDDARIHVGVIAQEVEQAFVDEGLDPRRYAMFCEDTLEDGSKRLGIRYDELLAFVIAAL